MKFIIIILFFLNTLDAKPATKNEIVEFCKTKASEFNNYKRLYKHTYNKCMKENKNISFNKLQEVKKNEKIINEIRTKNKQLEINNNKKFAPRIIGIWMDNYAFIGTKIVLYKYYGKTYLANVFKTYSIITEVITKKVYNGIQIFDIKGKHFGEYFLLIPNQDLEFWNKTKSYYTASKVKLIKYELEKVKENIIKSHIKLQKNIYKESHYIRNIKLNISIRYFTLNGKTYFIGKTNLPKGTKIGIQLNNRASDFQIYISSNGEYESIGFSNLNKPLIGKYKVEIMIYNNQAWQTKEIINKLNHYYGYGLDKEDKKASILKEFIF